MKAYPSGLQAALQGLSDTLGGTAEFQRDTETTRARTGLAQQELQQRMLEEQRRSKLYDLQLREAERKIATEDAQRAFHFDQAQSVINEERDAIFQRLLGEKPTIDDAKGLQKLERLATHLQAEGADPEQLIKEHTAQRQSDTAATGLEQFAQEVARPIQEGLLTDPGDQQQVQLYQQGILQAAQMVRSRALKPQDGVDFIERVAGKMQELQLKAGARQQKLEAKQRAIGEIDTRMQTLRPGDPRAQKLAQMKPLVLSDMVDPDDAGKMLMAQDLGIPEARMTEFLDLVKEMQAGRTQQAIRGDPLGAIAGTAQDIGMQFPQANGQAAQAPQASVPRGALVRLRDAVKAAQSPEEIDALAQQLGIQQLSPEEKAFVLGG